MTLGLNLICGQCGHELQLQSKEVLPSFVDGEHTHKVVVGVKPCVKCSNPATLALTMLRKTAEDMAKLEQGLPTS